MIVLVEEGSQLSDVVKVEIVLLFGWLLIPACNVIPSMGQMRLLRCK